MLPSYNSLCDSKWCYLLGCFAPFSLTYILDTCLVFDYLSLILSSTPLHILLTIALLELHFIFYSQVDSLICSKTYC